MNEAKGLRRVLWSVPLGLQLAALYTVLLVGTLALLGTALYSQLDRFLVENTATRLDQAATTLVSRIQPFERGPGPGDRGPRLPGPFDLNRTTAELVRGLSSPDVLVEVLDVEGVVITSTNAFNRGVLAIFPTLPDDWIATVEDSQSRAQWVLPSPPGGRRLVVASPVTVTMRDAFLTRLYLVQAASLDAADDILGQLRLYLLLGIVAGTLIGVPAGLLLTRAVLKPLGRMARTADAIAAGDTSRRLHLPEGSNEVARLGGAFDQMMDRLDANLEAQRRFVADASHEIRTPLTSLEGLSEMLLIGADKGDTQVVQRILRSMHGELGRLRRLVADLLTLSRLDSSTPLTFASVDLCAMLTEVSEQMAPVAERKTTHISVECTPGLAAHADADRLRQVMLNLVDNAIRYSPPEGTVCLKGVRSPSPGRVHLQVLDQGPGIPAENLPHIFDRFYRGDASRARVTGNAGLGLSIARAIVEAHGGTIAVQSAAGEGTAFTVALPETPISGSTQLVVPKKYHHQVRELESFSERPRVHQE
jgi:two-component system OmpR family sensor kinase